MAAVCDRYGPPEVIRVAAVPRPAPRRGEVLIRVHATTVNRTDTGVRSGHPAAGRLFYGLARPRARVLGCEFAGVVEAAGDGAGYRPGDAVFGFNGGFGARGEFGAHAEYVIARADSVSPMPASLTFEQAAACGEGTTYALGMIQAAGIAPGTAVLVYGATGAIGSAAVQLLMAAGARVTAVCATPHLALVTELGAERAVDYTATDFTSDGQRYDAVFDAVGKTTFRRCRRLLKPGGLFLAADAGPHWQNLPLALLTPLGRGRRVVMPAMARRPQALARVRKLIESGRFAPVIDRRYRLADIADAHRYVDTGQKVGCVVITVAAPGLPADPGRPAAAAASAPAWENSARD